jgi:hypothetical protein
VSVRPGLLVELPCSVPGGPGVTPVFPEGGAGVVPVLGGVLGGVVAGGCNGVAEVPGRAGGDSFEGPAAEGGRSCVGRDVLLPARDASGRRDVVAPSVADTAAPRLSGR